MNNQAAFPRLPPSPHSQGSLALGDPDGRAGGRAAAGRTLSPPRTKVENIALGVGRIMDLLRVTCGHSLLTAPPCDEKVPC